MSLYSDLQPQYATSQRIKDALAPFRRTWDFTPSDTISGVIPIPSNLDFINLLDARISYDLSGTTRYVSLELPNEDELSARLNSQIDPVTVTSPIGEVIGSTTVQITASLARRQYYIRVYPAGGYNGRITYLKRPAKPNFVYTTISQRVIVYNDALSTQLDWPENWQNAVLLKALESIGINLTDQEISNFAEAKTNQNFLNQNRT